MNLNGACRDNCGSPFMYNDVTFELEPNPDFLFQYGRECVERCPKCKICKTVCFSRLRYDLRVHATQVTAVLNHETVLVENVPMYAQLNIARYDCCHQATA